MDIINDKNFSSENRTVVTFGKFDGIHTGHKLLINKAVAIAEKEGLKTILCTFDMRKWKSHSEPQITDVKEKEIICNELGVDILLEIPFDDSIALLEPEEFINEFIRKKLNAEYVVVGTDWKYGKDRKGDVEGFDQKFYLSVPLWHYQDKLNKGDHIVFNLNTYQEGTTSRTFIY